MHIPEWPRRERVERGDRFNGAGAGGYFMGGGAGKINSIQYGTVAISNAATTNTAAITSVDVNNAFIIPLGMSQTAQAFGRWDLTAIRLTLTNATTVTATRGAALSSGETLTQGFVVVEFVPGFLKSVQQGTIDLNGLTSGTATVTGVVVANAFLIPLGMDTTDSAASPTFDIFGYRVVLTNTTTVTASRQVSSAHAFVIGFVLVEHN